MPIDKGGHGERSPDDWTRIETEKAERDTLSRKRDETHGPGEEFEKAARPLAPDYGNHRPKHLELTEAQKEDLEATYGRPIEELLALREKDPRNIHHRDEHGGIRRPDADQPDSEHSAVDHPHESGQPVIASTETSDHGTRAFLGEIAEELRAGRLTPGQAAEHLEAYQQGHGVPEHVNDTPTPGPSDGGTGNDPSDQANDHVVADELRAGVNAWDHVEGDKPDRESIHVSGSRRIHILDGNGLGDGGHLAGTGVPTKSEFPETWDDDKVIETIMDVARNPDSTPELQRRGTWLATGTRDEVETNAILRKDGAIVTGFPSHGKGVLHNDGSGDPTICTHRENKG